MFSRLNDEEIGKFLPTEWKNEVLNLLNSIYSEHAIAREEELDIWGLTYPNELLLMTSLTHKNDNMAAPTTFSVSVELNDKVDAKKVLGTVVDSLGVFLDMYFSKDKWEDFHNEWVEDDFKGIKIYYRVKRENINHTLMACLLYTSPSPRDV